MGVSDDPAVSSAVSADDVDSFEELNSIGSLQLDIVKHRLITVIINKCFFLISFTSAK